ncbi:unnamed protein product [Bursaphelenchus xylophilus]|uniref:(pine wood nematode) hypothetical protein n=1 Tax=Bursaphelenchus xylophilus TaxID=6326 RepID=A0A1I7RP51_BURXY|nr:unnamed protein product [Bursaphelenchus xylophilus]CAG9124559.1 unnamed protein product [Bursaphelenchus xylophilus]
MSNTTDKPADDNLVLDHFTIVGISVVSCVAFLILIGTSIACWFDLRNRRHKLPAEGEVKAIKKKAFKTGRRRHSSSSTDHGSKEGVNKQELVQEEESDTPLSSTGTARIPSHRTQLSKRLTLSEKRRVMEIAAKTYSNSNSFFMDNTQSDSSELMVSTAKDVDSFVIVRKKSLDRTQMSEAVPRSQLRTCPKSSRTKSLKSRVNTTQKTGLKSETESSSSSSSSSTTETKKTAIPESNVSYQKKNK